MSNACRRRISNLARSLRDGIVLLMRLSCIKQIAREATAVRQKLNQRY